jgi:hypothetical protein
MNGYKLCYKEENLLEKKKKEKKKKILKEPTSDSRRSIQSR